ncbi:MAG: Gfo/Idh/MocA family oxidoreductase [Vicinamibacteria bacterium]|nr:Gfo/Idh/MocA family oxidoreductase [Vicinamibacteria bacterium]
MSDHTKPVSRRDLLVAAGSATAGLALAGASSGQQAAAAPVERPATGHATMIGVPFEKRDVVRVGLIGCGGRGMSLLDDLLGIPGVEVNAVCDVVASKVTAAQARVTRKGRPRPVGFTNGERDFENLCRRDDLDLVYVATPWNWHVPMSVAAMENGKHVGVEVPAANTLEECWTLVETSERTRRHCVILENCCYGYAELAVLRMVREGLLGEVLHAEAAYNHDLREILFSNEGEGLWRRFEHLNRDGNLYPTHGLGPVARCMDVNRGDRFARLVSMSSPERGLSEWRRRHVPKGDPKWNESYRCGDVNTSLIRTARGKTIVLQHTVATPHPYDRINLVSGTKGIFRGYPDRLYVDGQPGGERWAKFEKKLRKRWEHPLWTQLGKLARKSGHGGMDYVMAWRLVQTMREGLVPDMDVYDAAAWSAPAPLSEASVAQGGMPVEFPDFTRGRWEQPRA